MKSRTSRKGMPAWISGETFWMLILVVTTIFAFVMNYIALLRGVAMVTPHLFYLPIVIGAYWFPRRGIIFSVCIGLLYLAMVYTLVYPSIEDITSATARFYVFVAIGIIVTSLSGNLKEQEDRYHGIFDYSEAGVFLIRCNVPEFILEEVNGRGAALLRYRIIDLTERSLADIWPDEEEINRFWGEIEQKGAVSDFEATLKNRDGLPIQVLISAGTLPDNLMVFTITDISARKTAEEALIESKDRYQGLYNNALVGLVRTRISDGKVLEANEQVARMFGYDSALEFIDSFIFSEHYVDPGTRDNFIRELNINGAVSGFEARFMKKDGSHIWVRYWARIYPEKKYVEEVLTDISEEKKSQRSLVESEERYRKLVVNLPDYVMVYNGDSILFVNPTAASVVDKTLPDLLDSSIFEFIAPESHEAVRESSMKSLSGEMVEPYEVAIQTPSGVSRFAIMSTSPLMYQNEPAVLAVLTDITDRKLAEDALARSEDQYRTTIDAMSDGIYLVDKDQTLILVNSTFRKWLESLGNGDEIIGKKIRDVLPCVNNDVCIEFRRIFSSGETVITNEEFFDGRKTHIFETRKIPVFEGQQVKRVVTIMRDITEQKRIEEEKRMAYEQIEKNIEQFAVLGDHIRNPMQVIVGLADLLGDPVAAKIHHQAMEIDRTITQLDQGWIESEKIRDFIRKYYGIGKR